MVDAAHLSDVANRAGISAIAMSPLFYDNTIDLLADENEKYRTWITAHKTGYYGSTDFYHCNIVETAFDEWIDREV